MNHACDVTSSQSTAMVVVVWVGKVLGMHSYWDYLGDAPIELGLLM